MSQGHGFIGYPNGRNVERALGPSCPCVLCIPIHIITINIESFLGCHISPSLGLYLLHQIQLKRKRVARQSLLALRARALAKFGEVDTVQVSANSFNIAKQSAYCRATRSLFS